MYLRSRRGAMSILGIAGIATALMGTNVLAQNLIEGPPAKAHLKNPDVVGSTLDFPTGDYQGTDIASGRSINMTPKPKVVWEDVLRVDGVAWLRLYFSEVHLEGDSFIRVTSLHDGEVQELDAASMAMWSNSTAYFNGNALKIELVAGAFTIDNEFRIDEYAYELGFADRGDGCGICGNDDRAPASVNHYARLFPVGCSATVYNEDSCMVTAGHCLGQSGAVVQFNVPDSNGDCSTNNPPVADQFPVTQESGYSGGVGDDYGALRIGTNSAGETPYTRYGTFVPLASSVPGSGSLSNHGYGVDSECNRSQTQQNHSGPINYTDSSSIAYDIDLTYGNSGSSLIYNDEIIGVVTHCSYSCENYATRIDTAGFQQALAVACDGDDPSGDCPVGEIEDCNGNCCPANWLGDGYCDDGSYTHNGIPIYLNCDEFDCDYNDCPPENCQSGGDPTGACCEYSEPPECLVTTEAQCAKFGNTYLGDGTDCVGYPCGDAPTGACCIDAVCKISNEDTCNLQGGFYLGDGTTCANDPCGDDGNTCNTAIALNSLDVVLPFDTSSSTPSGYSDPDESQCEGTYLEWDNSPDLWVKWPGSGLPFTTLNVSTCDVNSYDTSLVLYKGQDCNSLVQVACNGDAADSSGCQPYHSEIELVVDASVPYWVRIGGWQGDTGQGTLTITTSNTLEEGACCNGTDCTVTVQVDCESNGGTFLGMGTNCEGNPCDPGSQTGGCCVELVCSLETEDDCNVAGGTYLGDGTTCNGSPCSGADGKEYLEIAGIDSYDEYGSPSNVTRTMTIPAGATITGVGWNNVTLSAWDPSWGSEAGIMFHWESDGEDFAGYILIFGDEAAPGDFGPSTGFEDLTADWNFSDADGEILVEFFELYDDQPGVLDATWTNGDIYLTYETDNPIGACCYLAPDGHTQLCIEVTQEICEGPEFEGTYLGAGISCGAPDYPCVIPGKKGACCLPNGDCEWNVYPYCIDLGGTFLGEGTTCEGDPCNDPPATGACCLNDDCFASTADACNAAGGDYQGDNSDCANVDCGGGGGDEITVTHVIVGTGLLSFDQPNWTVDLYITMSSDQRLDAVAGTPDQQKTLTCSGSFYQSLLGGPTSKWINPALYNFYPDLQWDSRVSIGCIDMTGYPFDENNLQDIGINWIDFENGNDLSVGNGLWFHLPSDPAGESQMFTAQDCTQQYGVHLARLTVLDDGSEVGFEGMAQGRDSADNIFQENVETYFGYTPTEDCNGNMIPDACDIANGHSDDANGNGIPDECDDACPGDADGDGDADVDDVLHIISFYGSTNGDGDITGDGVCDVNDILELLNWYGDC